MPALFNRTSPIPKLEPVPPWAIGRAWPLAEPWVDEAVKNFALTHTADTVRSLCLDGKAQLWLAVDGGVAGAILTEVIETTKGLTCHILAAAGSFERHGEMCLDMIEQWAKAEGCVRLEETGRRGWLRALTRHGWQEVAVVMEKRI